MQLKQTGSALLVAGLQSETEGIELQLNSKIIKVHQDKVHVIIVFNEDELAFLSLGLPPIVWFVLQKKKTQNHQI